MKLARWLVLGSLGMFLGMTTVMAQEGAQKQGDKGRKGRGQEFRREFMQTMRQIRQKEHQLLQQNPELKEKVSAIDGQIEDLQKQRQAKFAEADPDLAELYGKVNEFREKAKARGKQFQGGRRREHGKKKNNN